MVIVNSYGVVHNNIFPKEIPVSVLEKTLNESFIPSGKKIIDGYFNIKSPHYPQDLWLCVYALNKEDFHSVDEELIGGLIATKEKLATNSVKEGEFEFKYFDKVGVKPSHQRNGAGKGMINAALEVYSEDKKILPSVLRTSDPDNHEYYKKRSDICFEVETESGPTYYIHGFGFRDKEKKDLFENATKLFEEEVAPYIASKPPTLAKIHPPVQKYAS